jgi:hypothetical protein
VYWDSLEGVWQALLPRGDSWVKLGDFDNEEAAALAYDEVNDVMIMMMMMRRRRRRRRRRRMMLMMVIVMMMPRGDSWVKLEDFDNEEAPAPAYDEVMI